MARHPTKTLRIKTYPKQQAFLECPKRILCFTGGRGSGKSRSGAMYLCLNSKAGGVYFVIAPNYAMLDGTIRTFVEVAKQLELWNSDASWASKPPRAILHNGAEVLFRSGDDPESLRGGDKAGAWLDEMQNSDEEVFRVVEPCLRQWGKLGWLVSTFTPGSPEHWTSKIFINPINPEDVGFFRASLKENVFAPPGQYEALLRSWAASPLRIKRELDGECVYLAGAEWLPEFFENVGFDQWPTEDMGGIRVISLDPSKGSRDKEGDYSAFVLSWFVPAQRTIYLDADMRNDRGDVEITQTGVQLFKAFQPHYFVIENESRQNEHLIRDMHRIADRENLLMPITPINSEKIDKKSRIRRLAGYVSEEWFRFKNDSPGAKILKEQFLAFPLGHDDGPDSVEMGIRVLQKATAGMVLPVTSYGLTPMGQIIMPHGFTPAETAA